MRTNLTIAIAGLAVLVVAGCSPRVEPTSPAPRTSGTTAQPGNGTAPPAREFDNRMNQQSSAMADAMRKRNAAQSGK